MKNKRPAERPGPARMDLQWVPGGIVKRIVYLGPGDVGQDQRLWEESAADLDFVADLSRMTYNQGVTDTNSRRSAKARQQRSANAQERRTELNNLLRELFADYLRLAFGCDQPEKASRRQRLQAEKSLRSEINLGEQEKMPEWIARASVSQDEKVRVLARLNRLRLLRGHKKFTLRTLRTRLRDPKRT